MLFQTDYTIYTLPIFDRVRVRVRVRFNAQIKFSNSMIFINLLSASCPESYGISDRSEVAHLLPSNAIFSVPLLYAVTNFGRWCLQHCKLTVYDCTLASGRHKRPLVHVVSEPVAMVYALTFCCLWLRNKY